MRARPPQIDWRMWLDASLFPLKIFIVLAVIWLTGWYTCLRSEGSEMADFYTFANFAAFVYILAGLILTFGGTIQAFYSSRRAAIWSISFALAGVIIGLCMWFKMGEYGFFRVPGDASNAVGLSIENF